VLNVCVQWGVTNADTRIATPSSCWKPMSLRFIHSADWQLGARFTQFGGKAELLRNARLQTWETALRKGDEFGVDAFLIAGDLFEDSQVDDTLVRAALSLCAKHPKLRVFILPGNHDPATGPGSVWERNEFTTLPKNVVVLKEPGVHELAGGFLIAAPLKQKVSTHDPSLKIAELARDLPADKIQVGITHGAIAIPGKHKPNDFPIALDAASRAGVDYLAVGHWHNWQTYDNDRLLMPGTPEPDSFDQENSGSVALVEISNRGALPKINRVPVATLTWQSLKFDFVNVEAGKKALQQRLDDMRPSGAKTVLRVTLHGSASPQVLHEITKLLQPLFDSFLAAQMIDGTTVAFTAGELEVLQREHPLLAQTIADLFQVEHLATNTPLPAGIGASEALSLAAAQELTGSAKIELTQLDTEFFKFAHQLLSQKLQEVGP